MNFAFFFVVFSLLSLDQVSDYVRIPDIRAADMFIL